MNPEKVKIMFVIIYYTAITPYYPKLLRHSQCFAQS